MPKTGTLSVQQNPVASGIAALSAPWAWDSYTGHNVINCAAFFGDPNYDDVETRNSRKAARTSVRRETAPLGLNVCMAIVSAGALGFMRLIERR